MDIGLQGVFGSSPRRDGGFLREFASGAEELGFASLWAPEHIVFFPHYESKYPYTPDGSVWFRPDEGIYDPIMVCQAAAAATTTLRVGTSVRIATERHPLLTAKLVMTLDHLSGGRFVLGVGSGWSAEEYAALGIPFDRRGARLDEHLLGHEGGVDRGRGQLPRRVRRVRRRRPLPEAADPTTPTDPGRR
jgi:alkanesulfonate monooxygenase SsuD/methylene tetrahydromethanopterin reductase-like flavin-dependent oxidoreductase (luciferase family)